MRYSFILAALSASTAIASPWGQYTYTSDREITVALSNSAKALGSRTEFTEGKRQEQAPGQSTGPFTTVQILVGKNVRNKEIRCQLLDGQGKEIKAERGPNNQDVTFADAGKGEWKFLQESEVSKVICDPEFKKGTPPPAAGDEKNDITVKLIDEASETTIPFSLSSGKRDENDVGTAQTFSSVNLESPADLKDKLRCQILDKAGKEITVKRGPNVDTTFSDAGKGAWTFKMPASSQVGKIVCDPDFKAHPQ